MDFKSDIDAWSSLQPKPTIDDLIERARADEPFGNRIAEAMERHAPLLDKLADA